MLCKYYVAKSFEQQKKKRKKYDGMKRKVRKIGRIR
jgi:hypothetical protein